MRDLSYLGSTRAQAFVTLGSSTEAPRRAHTEERMEMKRTRRMAARRVMLSLAMVTAMALALAGPALAMHPIVFGTDGADRIRGTSGHDDIRSFGGDDAI